MATFFGRPAKMTMHFLLNNLCYYSDVVITTTLFGLIGDCINGVPLYLKLYVITTLMTKINVLGNITTEYNVL